MTRKKCRKDYLVFKKNYATFTKKGRGFVYIVPRFSVSEYSFINFKPMIADRDRQIKWLILQLDRAEKRLEATQEKEKK